MLKCSKCGHQNRPGTFSCDNCSWLLEDEQDTVYIPEEDRQKIISAFHIPYQKIPLPSQALQLSIESALKPIILLPSDKPYLIGRSLDTASYHNINLNPYNAAQLGISRRHATLYQTTEGWMIEDLDSTNGTYINDHKLGTKESYLVKRGDLLQFGLLISRVEIEESGDIPVFNL